MNPKAYGYFLRGRVLARTFVDADNSDLRKAIEYFNLAVDADPAFSDAFVALAQAYIS